VITNGSGATPAPNDLVTLIYSSTLIDGKMFDNSGAPGHSLQVPVQTAIRGWTEALMQMKAGSKWRGVCAGGTRLRRYGPPGIPANSVLIIEVELLATEHPKPPEPLTSDIIKVPSQEEMKKGAKIEVINRGRRQIPAVTAAAGQIVAGALNI